MNRRGLYALVHCAKKELGLDDGAYRAALEQVAGKSSSKDLSDAELGRVVEHFKRIGWRPKSGGDFNKNPSVRKVWAIWAELGKLGALHTPTPAGLRAFCKNLVGVENPSWMSPEQLNKVIESLKVWQKRARKGKGGADAHQ